MTRLKRSTRLGSLVLANLLIPVAIILFATGFFPYKPFLSGLATFEEAENEEHGLGLLSGATRPERVFDKVIFMVVDALRSDFVYGHDSGFLFTQSLIRTGAAVPFTAHAAPPTVTMPRVKGLTSGSVPSFLDLILNFAESDTSSSLATQDTWLAQIKAHLKSPEEDEGKIVFYGDDTWLKLFPDFFHRVDGTTSFFVSDFTEVDNNVTRHLPHELQQPDWNGMIMHYLGLDHIGHKSGPLSPNMLPKQREMDGIVETIYDAIDNLPHLQNTLLVLAGDHGMNAGGNHGGSAPGETSPALVFISPKLRQVTCDAGLADTMGLQDDAAAPVVQKPASAATIFATEQRQRIDKAGSESDKIELANQLAKTWGFMSEADKQVYESLAFRDKMRYEEERAKVICQVPVIHKAPTSPKDGTEFEYYRKVEQSDLVPTLAALLGVPVSRNNLGIIIPEMLKFWTTSEGSLRSDQQLLYRNALQVLTILKAAYGDEPFAARPDDEGHIDVVEQSTRCLDLAEGAEQLSCKWHLVQHSISHGNTDDSVMIDFLKTSQDTLSASASSYNVTNLVGGTAVAVLATLFAIYSKKTVRQPTTAGIALAGITALYGIMMFASSYVEEEQHFWYWVTSAWLSSLYFTRPISPESETSPQIPDLRAAIATFVLLAAHRLMTRWNQTGQKFAGAPDIAHDYFPAHHIILWVLILTTYIHISIRFARRTFSNLASPELAVMTALSLTLPSLMFKLNFTQADAPELVQGLAKDFREFTAQWDLVLQARATFMGIAIAFVAIVLLMWLRGKWIGEEDKARVISLPQRLHDLLTIFLITQTRAQNIPLFLVFEIQLQLLYTLLSPATPLAEAPTPSDKALAIKDSITSSSNQRSTASSEPAAPQPQPTPPILPATITILLLTHVSYFALGGSNAISSIDLSNAYNGVSGYNILAVGILLFCSNWAGPLWWSLAGVLLIQRLRDGEIEAEDDSVEKGLSEEEKEKIKLEEKRKERKRWVEMERSHLAESAKPTLSISPNRRADEGEQGGRKDGLWVEHLSTLTIFVTAGLVAVMVACTVLRTHLFIWTVFSPKFLYAMAWALAWHLIVNVGLGSLLYWLGRR